MSDRRSFRDRAEEVRQRVAWCRRIRNPPVHRRSARRDANPGPANRRRRPRGPDEALQEGGSVIYFFWHGATDTACDQNVDLTDCATQRNLSERGREQAREIGAGFTALGIPVGEVRSSEFCRAAETAKLAFGEEAVTLDPNLTPLPEDTPAEQEAKAEAMRELLSTPPEAGTNTVIVAHQHNIDPLGIDLDEGEAAVFLPA